MPYKYSVIYINIYIYYLVKKYICEITINWFSWNWDISQIVYIYWEFSENLYSFIDNLFTMFGEWPWKYCGFVELKSLLDQTGILAGLSKAPTIVIAFTAAIFECLTGICLLIVIIALQAHSTGSRFQWLQAFGICREDRYLQLSNATQTYFCDLTLCALWLLWWLLVWLGLWGGAGRGGGGHLWCLCQPLGLGRGHRLGHLCKAE